MDQELDEFATKYLKESGAITGRRLYDGIRTKFPSLTEVEFSNLVFRLAEGGKAEMRDDSDRSRSFLAFLGEWDTNIWYYASISVSLVTTLIVYTVPPTSPAVVLRWCFGLVFVLFLPGYVMVEALIPTSGLKGFDRCAVSVGASLVLDMLIGLLLNYTPWRLQLLPIVISLTAFSMCSATIALARKFMATAWTNRVYKSRD
jgi:uncharacterized membrane protein